MTKLDLVRKIEDYNKVILDGSLSIHGDGFYRGLNSALILIEKEDDSNE